MKSHNFCKSVSFLVGCMFYLGCAGTNSMDSAEPITLRLKGVDQEQTALMSLAHTKTYLHGQIRHEKVEKVDFAIKSELKNVTNDGIITFDVETTEKKGFINLREMAFPELKERLTISYAPNGEVIQAGNYPDNSIFYVPPVSLPEKPIKVGDTWKMQAEWMSSTNKVPLKLDVVTIFKGLRECYGGRCAELEVSGSVKFESKMLQKLDFDSRVEGHILFHIEQGRVVSSEIHNLEYVKSKDTEVLVKSCLVSEVKKKSGDLSCRLRKFEASLRRPSIFESL